MFQEATSFGSSSSSGTTPPFYKRYENSGEANYESDSNETHFKKNISPRKKGVLRNSSELLSRYAGLQIIPAKKETQQPKTEKKFIDVDDIIGIPDTRKFFCFSLFPGELATSLKKRRVKQCKKKDLAPNN